LPPAAAGSLNRTAATAQLPTAKVVEPSMIRIKWWTSLNQEVQQTSTKPRTNGARFSQTERDAPRHDRASEVR
jgi:hypothetical protein